MISGINRNMICVLYCVGFVYLSYRCQNESNSLDMINQVHFWHDRPGWPVRRTSRGQACLHLLQLMQSLVIEAMQFIDQGLTY